MPNMSLPIVYCKSCFERLEERGIIAEVYEHLCELYATSKQPVKVNPQYNNWISFLRFLEQEMYIQTCDAKDPHVFVKPIMHFTIDCEMFFCSGKCG